MVPAQPTLSPAGVCLNEFAQRITGVAGLAYRIDLVLAVAAALPPRVAVARLPPRDSASREIPMTLDAAQGDVDVGFRRRLEIPFRRGVVQGTE